MLSDRDAFIRAVLADTRDDAPRLVFADWLDEHGEPARAELIRLQCRIATDQEAPLDERRAWRQREIALLADHASGWLGPLSEFVTHSQFHRGFVDYAEIPLADFLRRGEEVLAHELPASLWLRDVTASDWPALMRCPTLARFTSLTMSLDEEMAPHVPDLARCPHLAGLRELALPYSRVGDAAVLALADSPYLRLRVLEANRSAAASEQDIGAEALARLAGSPAVDALVRLNLNGRGVGDAGAVELAASHRFGQLRELRLDSCNLTSEGLDSLSRADWLAGLETLGVPFNDFDRFGVTALASVPLPRLRQLDLWYNTIGPGGLEALSGSPHFPELRKVDLNATGIGDVDLAGLRRAVWLPQLRELDLSGNSFSANALRDFLRHAQLSEVRDLSLGRVGLDADTLAALLGNPSAQNIRRLSLNDNPLGDEGLRLLLRADAFPHLECLRIPGCQLTAAGLTELAASPRFGRLRTLWISGAAANDDGLVALAASPGLATLEILSFHGQFGEAGWRALVNSPNLSRDTTLHFFGGLPGEFEGAFVRRQRQRASVYVSR